MQRNSTTSNNNRGRPNSRRRPPRRNIVKTTRNGLNNEANLRDRQLTARIPKPLQAASPFPSNTDRNMTLTWRFNMSGASPFIVSEFYTNDITDPMASLGAVNVPGFSTMCAIYQKYTVKAISCKFSLTNMEATMPVTFGIIFRDSQPSASITTTSLAELALSVAPSTGPHQCGIASGASTINNNRIYKISNEAILGNAYLYYGNPVYSGTFTTAPTDKLWGSCLLYGDGIANLASGAAIVLDLIYHVHWFSLQPTIA